MVVTPLVGITVATQSAASAAGFGTDAFMNIDGSVRYVANTTPPPTNQFGWANGPATGATPGSDLTTCAGGGVHAPGSNGLYDCGKPNPGPSTVPLPPTYIGPAAGTDGVLSQVFFTSPTPSDTVTCTSNPTTTATGAYILPGGTKFNSGLSQLGYSTGSVPPKDAAADAYAISRVNSSGDVEVFFGAQRTANNGDSHVDFQFLQDAVGAVDSTPGNSCSGTFSGSREQGDVLVDTNYVNGGGVSSPNVFQWTCNTSSPLGTKCDTTGNWVLLNPTPPIDVAFEESNSAAMSCGGWVCKGSPSTQIPSQEFVEGAINLGHLGTGFQASCGSTLFVETSSSQSGSSQLKTVVKPAPFADCAPTTTKTTPSSTSQALGSTFTDSVTVNGTAGRAPTGTVTFYECAIPTGTTPAGCDPTKGTQLTGTQAAPNPVTLTKGTNSSTAVSPPFTPTAAGNYCFAGVFTPDPGTFYSGSSDTSVDECFTVTQLTPGFTTTITSPQSSAVGNSWNDTATLTGTAPYGAPTGSVTFSICKESAPSTPCSSGGSTIATVSNPVVNGVVATYALPSVNAQTPTSIGTYCFYASYSATAGGNYSSVSKETNTECFDVTPASSATSTIATGHAVAGGFGTVTDSVTVTGNSAGGDPTGTVSFYFCKASSSASTPGTCPVTATSLDTETLSAGTNPDTGVASTTVTFAPTSTGTWCFGAVYTPATGSNYLGSADNTTAGNTNSLECVNIASVTPALSTTVVNESSPSNITGATYHDTAKFTSTAVATPTGTVTYTLFSTSSCSGTTVNSWTVNLNQDGTIPDSPSSGALGAGSYCYLATYNGDSNYDSASAANEPFSIGKAPTTINTTVFDASTKSAWDLTNGELAPASSYDTYSLTGLVGGFTPAGTVTYTLYSGSCTGSVLQTSTVSAGDPSPTFTGLAAGSYGYIASYSGDSNYLPSGAGSCEPFTVVTPILTAVKSATPTPVGAGSSGIVTIGQTITYTIKLTNSGTAPASDVTLTDAIPAGTTAVTGSASATPPNGSGSVAASGLSWTFANPIGINSSESVSFQVTVNSNDTNGQKIDNFAVFTNEGTPNCSTATCDTNTVEHIVGTPIIDAAKSEPTPGDGVTVTAGQSAPITYTIAVTNAGLVDAKNVVVKDVIPTGATYVSGSATPVADASFSGGTVTWTLPTVPAETNNVPGEVDVTFQVTVNASDQDGSTITNQASFSDVNTGSCVAAAAAGFCLTNTVSNQVIAPIVTAAKSSNPADGSTVPAGSNVTYTITLTNSGHADTTDTVTDTVPAGTTFVSASGAVTPDNTGLITWSNVPVKAQSTAQVSFIVTVNLSDADGTVIPNHAIFGNVNTPTCDTSDGDTSNSTCDTNTVTLTVIKPIINVVKSEPTPGNGQTVTAGQSAPITYSLSVTNAGTEDATNVLVTDAIPAGATYVPNSANLGGQFDQATKTITWTVPTVPGAVDGGLGTAGPLTFQVTVNAADANGSTITNQAAFSNVNTVNCIPAPVQGSCLTNQVSNPVIAPIISVVKSEPTPGNGQTVTAGQSAPITYNLNVTNTGSAQATGVIVTDGIPAGSTYVANSANNGGVYDQATNTIKWSNLTVPGATNATTPGTFGPLSFQVTVNASDANGSVITNQAAFSDVNTVSCSAAKAAGFCLTNQVSNPVRVITPTPATAPQVTTTTVAPKLAFTGTNAMAMAIVAMGLVGSGLVLVLIGRRRNRGNI